MTQQGSCAPEGAGEPALWFKPRVSAAAVATVVPPVAAVVPAVFPAVATTVNSVGDDDGPTDGDGGPAHASCCESHVRFLP